MVLHNCDNPPCVKPSHLFLGDTDANMADMVKKGRQFKPIGELHPSAKLTDETALEVYGLAISEEFTQAAIGQLFGIHSSTVAQIKRKHLWKHIHKGGA